MRLLFCVCIGAMVALSFTGCGGGGGDSNSNATSYTTPASAPKLQATKECA